MQSKGTSARAPRAAFTVSPDVRRLCVGGRPLLFNDRLQQLFGLNDTADAIWRGLEHGEDPQAVSAALVRQGVPADEAAGFVDQAISGWCATGQIIPLSAQAACADADASRTVRLGGLCVRLTFQGAGAEACDAVFGHLYGPPDPSAAHLAAAEYAGIHVLLLDGRPLGAVEPQGLTPFLKATLTELYVDSVHGGFLAHGALLQRGDARLLITGQPGAGKTTLTVAMTTAGWSYGGDDIVQIDDHGMARGAPFAAAVKSGAWPLATRFAPEIADLPTAVRADGQQVRYWRPAVLAPSGVGPLTGVILLARKAGAPARIEPMEPLQALSLVLDSGYAASRRLAGDTLAAFARTLERARCGRLIYENLPEAVAALEGLAHVPA